MIVHLVLVNGQGDTQEHYARMEALPRKGEAVDWHVRTNMIFDRELDRHVRIADADWEGAYLVRKVVHTPGAVSVTVWAHKT